MSYQSRNVPIIGPEGSPSSSTGGTTMLLGQVVAIPPEATAAWVQPFLDEVIYYRMDGTVGAATSACLFVTFPDRLELVNRQQLEGCTLVGNFVVQFFTGRIGTTT